MQKGWLMAIGAVVTGALLVVVASRLDDGADSSGNVHSGGEESALGGTPSIEHPNGAPGIEARAPKQPKISPPPSFANREEAARAVAAAESELQAARAALREADLAIDDLEREVEAVERYVENLQQRGEDPARHAAEGMEQLRPLIDRYEARVRAAEDADERVAQAQADLDRIRDALASFGG